jgi:hypothetical protein
VKWNVKFQSGIGLCRRSSFFHALALRTGPLFSDFFR